MRAAISGLVYGGVVEGVLNMDGSLVVWYNLDGRRVSFARQTESTDEMIL